MALIWDGNVLAQAYTNYSRAFFEGIDWLPNRERLTALQTKTQLSLGSDILVVGSGLGGLLLALVEAGVNPDNIYGCDTSPWLAANRSEIAVGYDSKTLDIDISAGPDAFKPYFGGNGKVNWIVSELVLTSLQTDQEIADFATACENMRTGPGGIVHIFASQTPDSDSSFGMNWQPKEYWSDRLPDHILIDVHGPAWDPDANGGVGAWS